MGFTSLDLQLAEACRQMPLNYGRIQALIDHGANLNAEADETYPYHELYGNLMVVIFADWPCMSAECENCEKEKEECTSCPLNARHEIIPLIRLFIKNGLDLKRFGLSIAGILHYTYCKEMIPAMKLVLNTNFSDMRDKFKENLEGIWTEVSYFRCKGEEDIANLCYEEYKLYEAIAEGRSINSDADETRLQY